MKVRLLIIAALTLTLLGAACTVGDYELSRSEKAAATFAWNEAAAANPEGAAATCTLLNKNDPTTDEMLAEAYQDGSSGTSVEFAHAVLEYVQSTQC